MPATWDSASAANRFKGDCLNLTYAAERHAGFEHSDNFEHCVADYGADFRIDFEVVFAAGYRGGVGAGDRGWLVAVEDCAGASECPAEGVFDGGKACWWSFRGLPSALKVLDRSPCDPGGFGKLLLGHSQCLPPLADRPCQAVPVVRHGLIMPEIGQQ